MGIYTASIVRHCLLSDYVHYPITISIGSILHTSPFLDSDIPRSTSYGVYVSQLIRFARVSSHVADFDARNKSLTAKLLQQGYQYHKLRKIFSKFYRRHYELVSKFNVGLKALLHQGLSEPKFYGDLVYKFKKIEVGLIFLISSEKLSYVTNVLDIT